MVHAIRSSRPYPMTTGTSTDEVVDQEICSRFALCLGLVMVDCTHIVQDVSLQWHRDTIMIAQRQSILVTESHRWPMYSPHKGLVRQNCDIFSVLCQSSCSSNDRVGGKSPMLTAISYHYKCIQMAFYESPSAIQTLWPAKSKYWTFTLWMCVQQMSYLKTN